MTKREREVTDIKEIEKILDKAKVLHLGLVDDGNPYVLAMNYGYIMEYGKLTVYLHGAREGYKLDIMRKNPKCCFEADCDVEPFEGELPCQYGNAYASVIARGEITIVDDVEEKMKALTVLMKTQTGKDFEFNERLVSAVSVMRIDVSEYTAKRRPLPAVLQM